MGQNCLSLFQKKWFMATIKTRHWSDGCTSIAAAALRNPDMANHLTRTCIPHKHDDTLLCAQHTQRFTGKNSIYITVSNVLMPHCWRPPRWSGWYWKTWSGTKINIRSWHLSLSAEAFTVFHLSERFTILGRNWFNLLIASLWRGFILIADRNCASCWEKSYSFLSLLLMMSSLTSRSFSYQFCREQFLHGRRLVEARQATNEVVSLKKHWVATNLCRHTHRWNSGSVCEGLSGKEVYRC